MRLGGCVLGIMLMWGGGAFGETIQVLVFDQARQTIPGVTIQILSAQGPVSSALTDANGHAAFDGLTPAYYTVTAAKDGFAPLRKDDLDLARGGTLAVDLTLTPALARQEKVEVHGTANPVEESSPSASEAPVATVKELPTRPATVADALPLIPGIVRSPEGGLRISGGAEHRSALIVNSADVTDPATGQFGLTVPIDSVETLNVYQTPFLAEYGRFTAGLVSVETRRGGDKWKWELNDPFPEFRIRSWQLRGLKDATPRVNVEGPLIAGKLYFSEGFEYQVRKTEVYTLPFPQNQEVQEGVNSFAQLDWVASGRQLVTATVHIAPQRLEYANMNYFNPLPASPDESAHNYTETLADRLTIGGGLFENTLSASEFDARVWGQGTQDLTVTPLGNSGNYFAQQNRNAARAGWLSTYSLAPLNKWGVHNFKVGAYVAESSDRGQVADRPIDILNAQGQRIEQIAFTPGQPFRMSDTEVAFFGQDHWTVSPHLALDLGLRSESQELSESWRLAPRAGIAWSPLPKRGTVLRAGLGLFYDRVPLNVYSFSHYPNQVVTQFNADGSVSAGPFLYQNGLGVVTGEVPFVVREPVAGNFSPRSDSWSAQIEQPLWSILRLRVGYLENRSAGLVILNPVAPVAAAGTGAYLLSGTGRSRYRQFEVTARVRLAGERELFFSYVRSRSQGDLNDFGNYLGTFPVPIVRPNQFATLPADLPNRFLAWGVVRLPWGFRVAPVLEFRSGFPYIVTDVSQNYVGVPNQNRYPGFFSLDSRFSKDIRVSPKYVVRFSVSGYNLTDHFNPEAVHANQADPAYGLFFGQRGRRFTADFDVVF